MEQWQEPNGPARYKAAEQGLSRLLPLVVKTNQTARGAGQADDAVVEGGPG